MIAINRGHKRVLQSVVIEVADQEDEVTFASYSADQLRSLDRDAVQQQLVDSGEWTLLRTRPFGKVPAPGSTPNSVFVSILDTNPLALDPAVVIKENEQAFRHGLTVLSRLTDGPVWVCRGPNTDLPSFAGGQVREEAFSGKHPAGNVGTHIHYLDPVGLNKTVWSVGYQDVIAIGKLFTEGKISSARVVALTGPQAKTPRALRLSLIHI